MGTVSGSIWFRYLAFQWMFRDVNVKDIYLRSAALRHNIDHRHFLLTYLWRWVVVVVSTFSMGIVLESLGLLACVFFYTISAVSVCTCTNILVAYLMLGKT